ncbi:hypothetical protein BKI52_39160 [marine bacterium AO1-C]|nr:hypothetical protein BKI52_39160 [marine bacterium AO1-C]
MVFQKKVNIYKCYQFGVPKVVNSGYKPNEVKTMQTKFVIALACSVGLVLQAFSQDEQAVKILKKVNQAQTQKATQVYYKYTYKGWGKLAGRFVGEVKISRKNGMQLWVHLKTLDEQGQLKRDEFIVTNGRAIQLLDNTAKMYKYGTARGGGAYLMSYAWYAVFQESLRPQPFARATKDTTLKYEGTKDIAGVKCYVISRTNPYFQDREYWYFGTDDYLIHGQRKENHQPATEGGFTFHMSALKTNMNWTKSDFALNVPKSFKKIDEDQRPVKVGNQAPEWTLVNTAGKTINSQQLRGKVVVLDFWASWCNPCWQIMPMINALKKDYAQKNVKVLGVNVWENPKLDLKKYLKKKKLDQYEVWLDKDATVAKLFKIAYLPLIVVIDTQGKIAFLSNGRDAQLNKKLREAIDRALK